MKILINERKIDRFLSNISRLGEKFLDERFKDLSGYYALRHD